ncbi:hypothetical protein MT1254_11065 [Micrococcus luteus]|nr:hypothetical protein MT1254_11065 [Micrococcus luteus]
MPPRQRDRQRRVRERRGQAGGGRGGARSCTQGECAQAEVRVLPCVSTSARTAYCSGRDGSGVLMRYEVPVEVHPGYCQGPPSCRHARRERECGEMDLTHETRTSRPCRTAFTDVGGAGVVYTVGEVAYAEVPPVFFAATRHW